jgi:hypothetical protein
MGTLWEIDENGKITAGGSVTSAYRSNNSLNIGTATNYLQIYTKELWDEYVSDANTIVLAHLENNTTDSSSSPKVATNNGVTFDTIHSMAGLYCAYLDNASDYMRWAITNHRYDSGGVEAIIILSDVTTKGMLFAGGDGTNNELEVWIENGKINARIYIEGPEEWTSTIQSTTTLVVNTPYHVAYFWASGNHNIAIDGVTETTAAGTINDFGLTTIGFGKVNSNSSNASVNCYIDEFRFIHPTFTSADTKKNYSFLDNSNGIKINRLSASGTFTTQDSKTVTVVNGVITSIV